MENKEREVNEGELEDEKKMEKFYALLRGFRDARERRRRELQDLEKHESNKKKMKTNAEASFEWQDFTTEVQFRKPPLVFPKPVSCDTVTDRKGKKREQQHQDHALDLKLAL